VHRERAHRHLVLQHPLLAEQALELGLAPGQLAFDRSELHHVPGLGEQGADALDARPLRRDAPLEIDRLRGHVLRLRVLRGHLAEGRHLAADVVEVVGWDTDRDVGLVVVRPHLLVGDEPARGRRDRLHPRDHLVHLVDGDPQRSGADHVARRRREVERGGRGRRVPAGGVRRLRLRLRCSRLAVVRVDVGLVGDLVPGARGRAVVAVPARPRAPGGDPHRHAGRRRQSRPFPCHAR
jgi:hypothetical protein